MLHKNIALGDRHAAHNWEYANAAARTSATGFVSGDIGKIAWQLDNDSFWVLKATTPTWAEVSSSTAHTHANLTAIDAVSGTNTGDETASTIRTKLGITTLSGSNTGDQTATTVPNTPAGNIAATTVQAAINELDTEKLSASNLKTINGQSIVGSGDLAITGGSSGGVGLDATFLLMGA